MQVDLVLESPKGEIQHIGSKENLAVPSAGLIEGTFFVIIARKDLNGRKNEIDFSLFNKGKKIEETSSNFLGPTVSK